MKKYPLPSFLSFGAVFLLSAVESYAGGLERGGYSIDLLFDSSRFVTEISSSYVMPARQLKNVSLVDPKYQRMSSLFSNVTKTSESVDYFVPRIAVKFGLSDSIDCMGDYSQPWGVHSKPGKNWIGAPENIETQLTSHAFSGTCSLKYNLAKGNMRFIAGLFHQEISGFKTSLGSPLPKDSRHPLTKLVMSGVGRLDLSAQGWGGRVGAAYEIPNIALRVSLVYNSQVDLPDISGTLDLSNVMIPSLRAPGQVHKIYSSSAMPASAELKMQSGFAPNWLAFGAIKWVNWSILQSVPICVVSKDTKECTRKNETTSLDLVFRDGWTISGGIAHKLNETVNLAVQVGWDRGTSTGLGSLTDVWSLGTRFSASPTKNFEIALGAMLGILSAGKSLPSVLSENGHTYKAKVSYEFDSDFVTAIMASIKIKI